MTDTERMRLALEKIAKQGTASVPVLVLVKKGLGQFTFSPTF